MVSLPASQDAGCSPAAQDYLRALYALTDGGLFHAARATTSDIARRLAVQPASVTAMLQKLAAAEPSLVDYHKNHGARLTPAGERAALAVVRCHRLLELFLHEKLGYGWDEVHDEADRLEHVISAAMVERLAAALGQPTHDPHGHAIPDANLALPDPAAVALGTLRVGQAAVVRYVADDDPAVLRELDGAGLRPGAALRLEAITADGAHCVRLAGWEGNTTIGAAAAAGVFVSADATSTINSGRA